MNLIEVEHPDDGITLLRLNRPDRLNALNHALVRELHAELDRVVHDNDCRIVILTGAGRGFCAGADLKADPADMTHVASGMPGMVVSVVVEPDEPVKKGQKLLTIEAMKMQTTVNSTREGKVGKLLVKAGARVDAGDLLLTIE